MLPIPALKSAALAGFVCCTFGCGSAPPEAPPIGEARSAIYQGEASGAQDDAVVRVTTVNAAGAQLPCTGTLVAPNLVLTARHCVANVSPGPFECDTNGELITIGDPGHVGTNLDPASIMISTGQSADQPAAQGAQLFSTDAPTICRDDIAFLVLDRELAIPYRPVRVFSPIKPGESVTIVGYGSGSADNTRHRLPSLPVLSVGPDQVDPHDTSLTPPRSFAVGRSTCLGDSGAPGLSDDSGAVLGVASFGTGACESPDVRNFFVEVRTQAGLLRDAFNAAGQKPWYEGGTKPGTEPPASGGGCRFAPRDAGSSGAVPLLCVAVLLAARKRAGALSERRRVPST